MIQYDISSFLLEAGRPWWGRGVSIPLLLTSTNFARATLLLMASRGKKEHEYLQSFCAASSAHRIAREYVECCLRPSRVATDVVLLGASPTGKQVSCESGSIGSR